MRSPRLLFAALLVVITSGCAKIYFSPDAYARANNHNTIAIAPPTVSIAARKKVDAEAMKEQQKTESANFQKEIHAWLLKRTMQNRFSVGIQDIETTNVLLERAGYFDENVRTPKEICDLLDVDGVITSNFSLSKPMSEGGAAVLGVLTGVWGSTNQTAVTLKIHDRESQKMIWNYNHKISGSIGSSPASLVDALMRRASKKMPYSIY